MSCFDNKNSKKVTNAGLDLSKQYGANAQQSFGDTNKAIGDYKTAIGSWMNANPYAEGGTYAKAQDAVGNNVAAAGQNALASDINENAARTNENSANNAAVIAESRRRGQSNLANFLANANKDRIGSDVSYRQTGLDATSKIPGMYEGMYQIGAGNSVAALNPAASAAKQADNGFWSQMGPAIIGGASSVAGGFTPNGGKGCWIAEAIYGPDDLRTHLVREWLHVEFATRKAGQRVVNLYLRFGEKVAAAVKRSRILKAILKPLFDSALSSAVTWKAQQAIPAMKDVR